MNPSTQNFHMDGDNPMMLILLLLIMCPGIFGGTGQNPMMLIMLLLMMSGGRLF